MNYWQHYERLMERARDRVLIGSFERHHILPKCLGGTNALSNLVCLTLKEHYIAHRLLVKLHPNDNRLVYALVWIAKRCGNRRSRWSRRGLKHSEETKRKISLSAMGHTRGRGVKKRPRTSEHCANISAAKLGKTVMSAEARAKMSEAHKGKRFSKQHRRNLSRSLSGKPHDFSWNGQRVGSGNPNWKGGIKRKSGVL